MRQRFSYLSLLLFSVTLTSISTHIYVNAIDCDHFTDIYGGIITYNPLDNGISLPDGTTATLTCSDGGFETTSTCSAGTWNPPSLGSCGVSAVSISYTPSVVTYVPPVKRADENGAGGSYGVAAAAEPTSTVNCGPLTAPANSFVSYSYFGLPPYPRGTMATLNCHLGYAPVGMTAAECEGGSWSTLGTCQSASVQRCPPLLPIMNGIINYIPGGNGAYDYGSVAELSCGFGYSVSGNPQVTCESSGWTPAPGLGQCQEGLGTTTSGIGCSALSVFNGQVNYMQSNAAIPYSAGTMAILVCNSGSTVSGSSSAYCSNGIWSPTLGTCGTTGLSTGITQSTWGSTSTVGACPAMFAIIMNGQITYSTAATMLGTYNSGTTATLSCYSGSTVSGTQSATCNNGVWSPTSLGSCVTSNGLGTTTGLFGTGTGTCLALGGVLNGQITYSMATSGLGTYSSGTTATLTCTSGILSGSSTSSCQNGIWTPTLGTCSSTGFGTGLGTTGTASCYVGVMSLSGGTVSYSNGLTLGPWASGTTATLTCPSGTPLGQSTASCINGVWSPSSFQGCSTTGTNGFGTTLVGTGTSQCYIGVMSLAGGTVSYSTGLTTGPWASGTTATLTCPSGSPLGQSTASCINGVWNPSSFQGCSNTGLGSTNTGIGTGTVTGTPCYIAVMSLSGTGTVSYSTGSTLGPWNSGSTATLTCPSGGYTTGQSTATCQNGQWNPTSFQGCSSTGVTTGIGFGTTVSSCYLPMASVIGGTVSYSTGSTTAPFPAGTTATLTCTNGQAAQGQTTASCTNGMWSPAAFTGCGSTWGLGTGTGTGVSTGTGECYATLLAPLNGQIQYSTGSTFGPFPSGSTAYLTCNSGYTVSGTSSATCYGGQFSPATLGTCVYGSSTGTTINNGLGTASTVVQEKSPQNCDKSPLPLISNGQLTLTDDESDAKVSESASKDHTRIATVACNEDLTPSMDNVTVYCYQGSWRLKENPKCESPEDKKACLKPPVLHVSKGQILYSTGQTEGPFEVGTLATLICEFGTSAVGGSSSATCTDGGWSQEMATCRGAASTLRQCEPLERISHASIAYSEIFNPNGPFDENTYANLNCDFGTSPTGPITAVCHNGTWTPSLGHCTSPVAPTAITELNAVSARPIDARVTSGGGGIFAYTPPAASVHPTSIRCPPIKSASLTSTLKFDQVPLSDSLYPNSTIVRLICLEEGANVSGGVSEAECYNGHWLPPLGDCKTSEEEGNHINGSTTEPHLKGVPTCQPLVAPARGVISYIQAGLDNDYQFGSTAILNCELGYSVSGYAALSCTPSGSWMPTAGFGDCIENEDLVH